MNTFDIYRAEGIYTSRVNLMNLAAAWNTGHLVGITQNNGIVIRGLITGIRMESGYEVGQIPTHFLVTIDGHTDVYVRIPPASTPKASLSTV